MTDSEPHYTFTCPNCNGSYSILLERIPQVQARFRCPSCTQPMDFPSREEARVYARLQAQGAGAAVAPPEDSRTVSPAETLPPPSPPDSPAPLAPEAGDNGAVPRFRVEKAGFESDLFDRRGIRTLIRTGELTEQDRVSVDDAAAVPAGTLSLLKSLFKLRETSSVTPPARCRTHLDRVAFFKCQDSSRPLCEECAPERKYGQTVLRVCQHCGGTAAELVPA